jgi:N-acetylglutamate synthase-like GNAT family acetyltransferase
MEFSISTDKTLLNVERIQEYIGTISYWGSGRTIEEVHGTIENSFCFGMYNEANEQIGFARLVTDYVTFGYLMDVIIFDEYQGRGYGKELIEFIMNNEVVKNLQTIALKTKDAHGLYEKFDFKKIGDSDLWMAKDKVKLRMSN